MSTDYPSDFAAQLELAWAAGFFDGEGCTTLDRQRTGYSYAGVSIKQVVVENLERFRAAIGGLGRINGPYREVGHCHPISRYRAAGTEARIVLCLLWPYLGKAKRDQASGVLDNENASGKTLPGKRDTCSKGHPYDEANTYRGKDGLRQCRKCGVLAAQLTRRKKRIQGRAHCKRGHDLKLFGVVNKAGCLCCRICLDAAASVAREYMGRIRATLKEDQQCRVTAKP